MPTPTSSKTIKKLSPISDLLVYTFDYFKKNWKILVSIMAIAYLPSLINGLLPILFKLIGLGDTMGYSTYFIIVVVSILGIFLSILGTITVIGILGNKIKTKGKTLSNIFDQALTLFSSYLWVIILSTLLIFIGFLLLLIPGLILSIYYIFVGYVNIVEQRSGYEALKRSMQIAKGNWWSIFWRLLVLVFITLIFLYAPLLTITVIFSKGAPATTLANLIGNILIYLLTIALTSLGLIYTFRMYKDLK